MLVSAKLIGGLEMLESLYKLEPRLKEQLITINAFFECSIISRVSLSEQHARIPIAPENDCQEEVARNHRWTHDC